MATPRKSRLVREWSWIGLSDRRGAGSRSRRSYAPVWLRLAFQPRVRREAGTGAASRCRPPRRAGHLGRRASAGARATVRGTTGPGGRARPASPAPLQRASAVAAESARRGQRRRSAAPRTLRSARQVHHAARASSMFGGRRSRRPAMSALNGSRCSGNASSFVLRLAPRRVPRTLAPSVCSFAAPCLLRETGVLPSRSAARSADGVRWIGATATGTDDPRDVLLEDGPLARPDEMPLPDRRLARERRADQKLVDRTRRWPATCFETPDRPATRDRMASSVVSSSITATSTSGPMRSSGPCAHAWPASKHGMMIRDAERGSPSMPSAYGCAAAMISLWGGRIVVAPVRPTWTSIASGNRRDSERTG